MLASIPSEICRAYLDTNLVSELVKRKAPPLELTALDELLCRYGRGQVALVCSPTVAEEIDKIPPEHRQLHLGKLALFSSMPRARPGGMTRTSTLGTANINPHRIISDRLQVILKGKDASHAFVAWSNRIKYLVTCDRRTFWNRREKVKAACGLTVFFPSEMVARLDAMADDNILSNIPGELLGPTRNGLPGAEPDGPDTQRIIIRLPDGARAEVIYVKLRGKKGKSVRWFWTPDSARIIEERTGEAE